MPKSNGNQQECSVEDPYLYFILATVDHKSQCYKWCFPLVCHSKFLVEGLRPIPSLCSSTVGTDHVPLLRLSHSGITASIRDGASFPTGTQYSSTCPYMHTPIPFLLLKFDLCKGTTTLWSCKYGSNAHPRIIWMDYYRRLCFLLSLLLPWKNSPALMQRCQ